MTDNKNKWYHQIWFVVLMLLVLGPFGFPLLWKSSSISLFMKWFLTVLVLFATVLALWASVETVKLVMREYQEVQKALL